MKILIKNGRIVDPAQNIDEKYDIFIKDDKIVKCEKKNRYFYDRRQKYYCY